MKKKEKPEKMSEKEALKMLNELQKKAMEFNEFQVVKELGLDKIFKDIPEILEQSKRVDRARSDIYSEKFENNNLRPFLKKLALSLSGLTEKYRQAVGIDKYLDIRGDVADFLVQEGPWNECMGTFYQLDFLFESYPIIAETGFGYPHGYKSIVIALITALKMFNYILVKSEK